MNILECTIKMKKETRAHYERLAESVTDVGLQRLFLLLAAAEGEHIASLCNVQVNMNKLEMQGLNNLEERVCVYSPQIDARHPAEALSHDPDAYRHVVQDEEDTIEYFDRLGDQAESEELKRLCRLQATKEREHMAMLEQIYLFVEEPRTYLEWGEFSNLKTL